MTASFAFLSDVRPYKTALFKLYYTVVACGTRVLCARCQKKKVRNFAIEKKYYLFYFNYLVENPTFMAPVHKQYRSDIGIDIG